MATIKFKRGSGVPTGLTAYEAAWDTSLGRFFIHNGSTATWIGARIDDSTSLGGAGSCAYYVPTQFAVKTYVDNQVAGGAVSSVNGLTGAVTGVAFLGTAQTFTQLQSFSAGISLSNAGANLITTAGDLLRLGYGAGSNVYIGNQASPNNFIEVTEDSITIQSANPISGNLVTSVNGATGVLTAVSSLNGVTGSVSLGVGSGLSIASSPSARGITLANIGVLAIQAGSGLSSSGLTGNVTLTNVGVVGITGTANQVSVSATTGSVTLSLPSAITTPGSLTTTSSLSVGTDLTVTGNLTVNGTTTTVNSNTVTIQDPVIAIGGAGTTNAPPPSGDTKDRGIVFQYNSAGGKTGFFGHDQSTGFFTYIPTISSLASDVVTGTAGTAQFNEVRGLSGVTFTITAPATTSSIIEMRGGAAYTNTLISLEAATVEIGNYTSRSGIRFTENGRAHLLAPFATMSASRTYELPDHSGTFVIPSDLGTSKYLLMATGATTQPIWVAPDDVSSGITASAAKLLTVSSDTSDATCFLTFVNNAANSNQAVKYNSNLAYNAATNYLDVNIDCGAY